MNDLTIINRMMKELELAKGNADHRQEMLIHIRHVKLLCDLFLEDQSPYQEPQENQSFNEREIKAMLGEKARPSQRQQTELDHGDANGDSIFDF